MFTEPAFILRAVNYKESDKILTLFTRGMGKVSALARGARKSSKRFGGALEPFAVFEATLTHNRKGTGSMYNISEATVLESNDGLSKNLERLGTAAFLLELLREAAPEHESSESLFDVCSGALHLLHREPALRSGNLLLTAGMRILAQSGLAMSVSHCNACGKEVPPQKSVYFDALRGGVVCTSCGGGPLLLDGETAYWLRYLQQQPMEIGATASIGANALAHMQSVFETFINAHLEKKLKTPQFMDQLQLR